MEKIDSFKDLVTWQRAHELTLCVYRLSQGFPKEEIYGLTSQVRRASVSVESNIVEGFKRKGIKDALRFYNISDASLAEVHCQLIIAFDLDYITNKNLQEAEDLIHKVGKLLGGMIKKKAS